MKYVEDKDKYTINFLPVIWEKAVVLGRILKNPIPVISEKIMVLYNRTIKLYSNYDMFWSIFSISIVAVLILSVFLLNPQDSNSLFQILLLFLIGFPVLFFIILTLIAIHSPDPITLETAEKLHYKQVFEDFVHINKKQLNLFARFSSGKSKLILANKYILLELNMAHFVNGDCIFKVTDKFRFETYFIMLIRFADGEMIKNTQDVFYDICNNFDYETTIDDLFDYFESKKIKYYSRPAPEKPQKYLDINEASEAELTAIPGVTIARAKHAIKMRKKQVQFLTLNQFYKAIDLEEEFIEQIKSKGNKILLSELPEYKQIEMLKEL